MRLLLPPPPPSSSSRCKCNALGRVLTLLFNIRGTAEILELILIFPEQWCVNNAVGVGELLNTYERCVKLEVVLNVIIWELVGIARSVCNLYGSSRWFPAIRGAVRSNGVTGLSRFIQSRREMVISNKKVGWKKQWIISIIIIIIIIIIEALKLDNCPSHTHSPLTPLIRWFSLEKNEWSFKTLGMALALHKWLGECRCYDSGETQEAWGAVSAPPLVFCGFQTSCLFPQW